jgi:membrane-associated phospholipid phosphatase
MKASWLMLVGSCVLFAQAPPDEDRDVGWKTLIPNILQDQKHMWSFPARLAQGQDWLPTGIVLGSTAGLVVADPHISGYFRSHETFHGFNRALPGSVTAGMTAAVPISLLAAGLLRHDEKMKRTALLAGEAVADVELVQVVFKGATGRLRPADVPRGNLSDSWSDRSAFSRFQSSFPSGHALSAFAVATVVAHRYRQHRWVPFAAYGIASAIGFSRVSQGAHFSSDVLMGAALGYTITRFSVLRHRRESNPASYWP